MRRCGWCFAGRDCGLPSKTMRTTCVLILLKRAAVVTTILTAACSTSPPPPNSAVFPSGQVVDLSHTFDETTIFWPTAEPFRLEKVADGVTPQGYYYAANNFFTAEHGGTHLDAPIHFSQGGQAVEQIPVERFLGPAVIVDVTAQAYKDRDYRVTTDDLQRA